MVEQGRKKVLSGSNPGTIGLFEEVHWARLRYNWGVCARQAAVVFWKESEGQKRQNVWQEEHTGFVARLQGRRDRKCYNECIRVSSKVRRWRGIRLVHYSLTFTIIPITHPLTNLTIKLTPFNLPLKHKHPVHEIIAIDTMPLDITTTNRT